MAAFQPLRSCFYHLLPPTVDLKHCLGTFLSSAKKLNIPIALYRDWRGDDTAGGGGGGGGGPLVAATQLSDGYIY